MKTATITEAKNRLSALIDSVKSGESVLILDRGVPVARLEPATRASDIEGRMKMLERAGIVRIGTGQIPRSIIEGPRPKLTGGASAVEMLLEERRGGR